MSNRKPNICPDAEPLTTVPSGRDVDKFQSETKYYKINKISKIVSNGNGKKKINSLNFTSKS